MKVIFYRSKHQETTRGFGTMAVLLAPADEIELFLKDYPSLDIAAYNSPKAITVAGPVEDIDAAMKALRASVAAGASSTSNTPSTAG